MEPYIQISLLNDFIFCPRSIYFHWLYAKYAAKNYKDTPQVVWTLKHETIDTQNYSSRKNILQGISIYSDKYGIAWKIDLFDSEKGELIERKNKIKKIYDGYIWQVYAQYFCLMEMWYTVKKIFLHSLSDNQRFQIPLPTKKKIQEFTNLVQKLKTFDLHSPFKQNPEKCKQCIYRELCDFYS